MKSAIESALLIVHPSDSARASAEEITSWWRAEGVSVAAADLDDFPEEPETADLAGADIDASSFDIAVSLGGDGCMLRAVRLVSDADVPVLGVNYGKLGYLAEVEAENAVAALKRVQAGDYSIEERMRLSVSLHRVSGGEQPAVGDGGSETGGAGRTVGEADQAADQADRQAGTTINLGGVLNEVVLEKLQSGHTVQLSVSVNGKFFTNYVADGIILATPTGSTAYSMSARGPIVAPSHEAIILTPVSPHMIFDRPLILPPVAQVSIEVLEGRPAESATDGKKQPTLNPGDRLVCRKSPHPARLVTFAERDFLAVLKDKFDLNDR